MLSNSGTGFVRSLFSASGFSIDEVLANRAINCNGSRRGKLVELIVTNYPTNPPASAQRRGGGVVIDSPEYVAGKISEAVQKEIAVQFMDSK